MAAGMKLELRHGIPIDQLQAGDYVEVWVPYNNRRGQVKRRSITGQIKAFHGPLLQIRTRSHNKLVPIRKVDIIKAWGERPAT